MTFPPVSSSDPQTQRSYCMKRLPWARSRTSLLLGSLAWHHRSPHISFWRIELHRHQSGEIIRQLERPLSLRRVMEGKVWNYLQSPINFLPWISAKRETSERERVFRSEVENERVGGVGHFSEPPRAVRAAESAVSNWNTCTYTFIEAVFTRGHMHAKCTVWVAWTRYFHTLLRCAADVHAAE